MSHRMAGFTSALALLILTALGAAPAIAQNPGMTHAARDPGLAAVPADEVAAVRAATEKYRDVAVAIADGYVAHPMCIVAETEGQPRQLGGMGYHYFRPDLLGITGDQPRVDGNGTHIDWLKPGILLYEPAADGSLELVAVENLVWAKAWHEAGNEGPPSYHGNEYFFMVDNPETEVDEAHGFQPHYELHWWLYRDNPSGAFSPFNPVVSCANASMEQAMH